MGFERDRQPPTWKLKWGENFLKINEHLRCCPSSQPFLCADAIFIKIVVVPNFNSSPSCELETTETSH